MFFQRISAQTVKTEGGGTHVLRTANASADGGLKAPLTILCSRGRMLFGSSSHGEAWAIVPGFIFLEGIS